MLRSEVKKSNLAFDDITAALSLQIRHVSFAQVALFVARVEEENVLFVRLRSVLLDAGFHLDMIAHVDVFFGFVAIVDVIAAVEVSAMYTYIYWPNILKTFTARLLKVDLAKVTFHSSVSDIKSVEGSKNT